MAAGNRALGTGINGEKAVVISLFASNMTSAATIMGTLNDT